jgi:phosphatidylserine synthase
MKTESIKELRNICRPDKHQKFFIEFYNPIISIYFTKLFINLNVSANTVTWIMILLAFIGNVLLIPNNYFISILGAIILLFAYLLDWVDGEVARYYRWKSEKKIKKGYTNSEEIKRSNIKNFESLKGGYLDSIFHALFFGLLPLVIGINAYLKTTNILFLILGFVTSILFLFKNLFQNLISKHIFDYIYYNKIKQLKVMDSKIKRTILTGDSSKLTAKFYMPLIIAMFNIQTYFTILFFLIYLVTFIFNLINLPKKIIGVEFNKLLGDIKN